MNVTAYAALAQTRAHRQPPSLTKAIVLLENTHLHPSYKVAVVTQTFPL